MVDGDRRSGLAAFDASHAVTYDCPNAISGDDAVSGTVLVLISDQTYISFCKNFHSRISFRIFSSQLSAGRIDIRSESTSDSRVDPMRG